MRSRELPNVHLRLAEAEEALRAIRASEVDSIVVAGEHGHRVFTLEGAEQAYRELIESMNEGAVTITVDKSILYANQCFAKMIKYPLEQVMGGSFRRFLSTEDRAALRLLLKRARKSGSKIQVTLNAGDGSKIRVRVSIWPLVNNGSKETTFGMVVTDMTEIRRTEELLRALTHRVVQAQESERGRLALELHDTITQMLCAVLIRSQVLTKKISVGNKAAREEAINLHTIVGTTVEEVERISRNLRPSVLDHLGLAAILREAGSEFSDRTGVFVKVACVELAARLPADIELALYRILQETLKNVEKHAHAHHVTVRLAKLKGTVQLAIHDDGMGFDPDHHRARRNGKSGLGLLGMRERATSVGGILMVKSVRRGGTDIEVRIPLPPDVMAAN